MKEGVAVINKDKYKSFRKIMLKVFFLILIFNLMITTFVGCSHKQVPPEGIRKELYTYVVENITEVDGIYKSSSLTVTDLSVRFIDNLPKYINVTNKEMGLLGEIQLMIGHYLDYEEARDRGSKDEAMKHLKQFEDQLEKIKLYLKIK
ncbi:hypothetical protein [Alkaliphilus hydrothermalis]|uniref:Uncharacterized protein n=1 Tax=Alkaliphilus hydrothermalis TaxID=1482730 RepID=A0ABS2NRW9_9FIRM|nr:hypothetical protein [Alkaliphilus hydrothermalis]MBM7615676.1 hypothetical protein [Alkaliphilus hydrothermalis]